MSLKSLFLIIAIMGAISVSVYRYFPDYGYLLIIASVIIIFVGAFIQDSKKKYDRQETNSSSNLQDEHEYHNDFSKVPAGNADQTKPLPRSIGLGYGVGDKTMYEDLEKIGLVDEDHKKKN